MNEVIDMNEAEKNYGSVPVIQNCSFRIPERENYGLLASAVGMLSAFFGYIRRSPTASVVCAVILVCAATIVIVIAPEYLTGVLLLMAAVFLSITCLILRIMADHVKQMEV